MTLQEWVISGRLGTSFVVAVVAAVIWLWMMWSDGGEG